MIQAITQQLQQQLARINDELEPKGFNILEACPFIVTTQDTFYTVAADGQNKAVIEFNNPNPTQFSPQAADDLVNKYKPSNGHGPLTLVKMNRTDFIQVRKAGIEKTLAELQAIPQQDTFS